MPQHMRKIIIISIVCLAGIALASDSHASLVTSSKRVVQWTAKMLRLTTELNVSRQLPQTPGMAIDDFSNAAQQLLQTHRSYKIVNALPLRIGDSIPLERLNIKTLTQLDPQLTISMVPNKQQIYLRLSVDATKARQLIKNGGLDRQLDSLGKIERELMDTLFSDDALRELFIVAKHRAVDLISEIPQFARRISQSMHGERTILRPFIHFDAAPIADDTTRAFLKILAEYAAQTGTFIN